MLIYILKIFNNYILNNYISFNKRIYELYLIYN